MVQLQMGKEKKASVFTCWVHICTSFSLEVKVSGNSKKIINFKIIQN